MINRIIDFSVNNKLIIVLMIMALVSWGIYSITQLPVDAVPDITNNQVQVISIAPTLATQEVEKFITAPIEVSLATIPDIIELRSISRLGLSVVTIVFKDGMDIYKARQLISERLSEAESRIPPGLTHPELAPVSTGLGEIYQYLIRVKPEYAGKYTNTDLRTIQDWVIKRDLLGTPGVAEVNSYGGFVKEYEVAINPDQLRSMNVSVEELFSALEKNNENTGSAYIEKNQNFYFIRGIGLVGSLEDIGKIAVRVNNAKVPILVRDIANVRLGHAIRYGAFVCDTSEAVGGVVMMLKGSNSSSVIKDVKEKMKIISKSLPEGIYIEPYLDRADLVDRSIGTVTKNLLEGGLIVIFVLVILLGNFRAGLVVASVIPLSMLFAISMMNLFGISGNLMSLGAIDFGLIVDGAVIIVENVVHRLTRYKSGHAGSKQITRKEMDREVSGSANRMMSSATFGQIIILIVYLPILSLVGIEGKMFRPMAETVGFAILGALLLSLTYVPMVSALVLNRNTVVKENISDRIMKFIHSVFDPMIRFSLRYKLSVLIFSIFLFLTSLFVFTQLGGEFIPTLEEGDLASGIITLQGGSLTHTVKTVKAANKILKDNFPEVIHAVCKVGAGEIPTDPTPVETGDYIITMKAKKEWTTATSREEMVERMKEKVSVLPGVAFSFQQPISMRFNELMTGSKQDVAIKIFGDNLDSLAIEASAIEKLIMPVEGVEDIQVEKVTGSPQISVKYDRERIARYGLNIEDINKILRIAFAGSSAGVVYEEEKRFDLVLRFSDEFRKDIDNVRLLYVPLPDGRQIPLTELATVELKDGTTQVSRENTKRRITVSFNVRNRDVASIIDDIRKIIEKNLKLPSGYYVTYGGQFENLIAAQKRLSLAVPLALALIFILLYFTFHSVRQTLLIFSAVPMAAIGGVFALYLRGMNFSISAGVGFIALFGVAVLNGIVLIAEFNRLEKEEGMSEIYQRVIKGLKIRLRPVIITASVASLGFLPMALSGSPGAEVQRPLATVVIGGLISSTLLTLFVLPILYLIFSGKKNIPGNRDKISPLIIPMVFILGLLSLPLAAVSQNKSGKIYTLSDAIEQAVSRNGEAKISSLEIDYQKALHQSAFDFDKTSIGIGYGQMNSEAYDNEITVSQSFAFPSTYALKARLANLSVRNAEISSLVTMNAIKAQVKSTYFRLSYAYARLHMLQFQDSLFGNFLNAANLRYQTGESNLLEKVTAETQHAAIENSVKEARADIRIWKCQLQVLMNEKDDFTISDTILNKLMITLPPDSNLSTSNPGIASLYQQINMVRLNRQIEISKLFPDFNLGYFNQSMNEINPGNRYDGIQAGITLPLLFWGQKGRIESAKLTEKKAQTRYDYEVNALDHKQHILTQEYLKYRQSLSYYENSALRQADLIILQAGKSYKAGDIDYMEYMQNLRQGFEIRNQYLETLDAYNQSIISLELLMNKL